VFIDIDRNAARAVFIGILASQREPDFIANFCALDETGEFANGAIYTGFEGFYAGWLLGVSQGVHKSQEWLLDKAAQGQESNFNGSAVLDRDYTMLREYAQRMGKDLFG